MTDTQVPDQWQLDSGLREDMIFSIHGAYFAPHADYQDGKQLMLWLMGVDESEEPAELRMSIGSDWESPDGGYTIVHPTKKKQHINKSSIYGFWISYCFQLPDLAKTLIERGGPTDARIWIGLKLHVQNRPLHWGGNIEDQDRLMPVEFLGLTNDPTGATVASVPTSQAVPTPPPAPAAPPAQPDQVFDPQAALAAARAQQAQGAPAQNASPLWSKAVSLAGAAPDFATFLGQAFADADILADDELAERCADQTEAGVWAAAHA